jgi:hypothetical protein
MNRHSKEYLKTFPQPVSSSRVYKQSLIEVLIDPSKGDVTKSYINRMRVANLIGFVELNADIQTFTIDDFIAMYEHEFKEQAPGKSTIEDCLRCCN